MSNSQHENQREIKPEGYKDELKQHIKFDKQLITRRFRLQWNMTYDLILKVLQQVKSKLQMLELWRKSPSLRDY